MGISQGNLNYHFKNKVDLAIEHANAFEAELNKIAAPFLAAPPPADRVLVLLEQVLTVLWRYRFLLVAPNYLSSIDPRLGERYRLVHQNMRHLIRSTTTALTEAGAMRPPRQGAAGIIADNVVAVWMAWLQMHSFSVDNALDAPTRAMLNDCFEHHFSLLEPYVSKAFLKELDLPGGPGR